MTEVDVGEPDRLLASMRSLQRDNSADSPDLVEDGASTHGSSLAVESRRGSRARIVHVVCVLPLGGAARAEVAVARGGQRLAQSLLVGTKRS